MSLAVNHIQYHNHHNNRSQPQHRRHESSEISCCLKYMIFGSNVIFWLTGLSIMLIGLWAWTEKDIFNNFNRITNIALDPAFILIIGGCLAFTIGFTGCVGALRENTCLLAGYAIFLAILLLLEMTTGILGFIFKDWVSFLLHFNQILNHYLFIINIISITDQISGREWFSSLYNLLSRRSWPTKPRGLGSGSVVGLLWSWRSKRLGPKYIFQLFECCGWKSWSVWCPLFMLSTHS
jgi:hypothetical protein